MARIFSDGAELGAVKLSPDEAFPPKPLTVAQLVAALQMCDQSAPVYIQGGFTGNAPTLRVHVYPERGRVLIEWDTTYSPE